MAAKILIVDDEPTIAKISAHYLKKAGFDVQMVTNGTDAVRMAFHEDFHLILLDLMMPDLDGLRIFRILKRNPKTKGIPVMIVSAKSQEADVIGAINEGAVDYIVKPFDRTTLVSKVKATLEGEGAEYSDFPPGAQAPRPRRNKGPKILVVEDDHFIGRLMKYRLEQYNYEVILAKDGAQGLHEAWAQAPDLVLLDIMIPGMDGYEVCEALREDPATQQMPILMVSALSSEEDRAKAFNVGADDYMVKPFKMDELVGRIQALLQKSTHAHRSDAGA